MVTTRSSDRKAASSNGKLALRSKNVDEPEDTPTKSVQRHAQPSELQIKSPSSGKVESVEPVKGAVLQVSDVHRELTDDSSVSTNSVTRKSRISINIPKFDPDTTHTRFDSQEPEDTELTIVPSEQVLAANSEGEDDSDDAAPEISTTKTTTSTQPRKGSTYTPKRKPRQSKKPTASSSQLEIFTTPATRVTELKDDDRPMSASTTASFATANESLSDREIDDSEDDSTILPLQNISTIVQDIPIQTQLDTTVDDENTVNHDPIPSEPATRQIDLSNNPALSKRIRFNEEGQITPRLLDARPPKKRTNSQPQPAASRNVLPNKHRTSLSSFRANVVRSRVDRGVLRLEEQWGGKRRKFLVS